MILLKLRRFGGKQEKNRGKSQVPSLSLLVKWRGNPNQKPKTASHNKLKLTRTPKADLHNSS